MDRRGLTSVPRCPPSADQPDRLLGELQEARVALARAEHYLTFRRAYSHREETLFSAHHLHAAQEALGKARNTIDHVAEMLRIEAAEMLANTPGNRPGG